MNLYEDLQRNRAVFEAAVGAVEGKNTTGWEAADLGPVRPPPMGGGAAAQPTASPAPQARGGGPVGARGDRVRLRTEVYSLQGAGSRRPMDTAGFAAEPPGQAGSGGTVRKSQAMSPERELSVDGTVQFPDGDTMGAAQADGDPVEGLLRRLEADARLESQLLGEP